MIDLGSNSVRMSVFSLGGGKLHTLSNYRSTIKLSEGMGEEMRLTHAAQIRAVAALRQYKSIIDAEGITQVCAVATAAVRKSANKEEFLELVRQVAEIDINVIDGNQEAALDALAVNRTIGCDRGVICDIGGGSTELIGVKDGDCCFATSTPIGSRGITEKFFANGETEALRLEAEEYICQKFDEVAELGQFKGASVVGIGGTLRAVAKYDIGGADSSAVQKHIISAKRMTEIIDRIEKSSVSERENMQGIGKERADIILGGLLFVRCLLRRLLPQEFIIADVGVREGVAFDYFENSGILRIK